jgi:hypothetical protein
MESTVSAADAVSIFGRLPDVVQAWLTTRAGHYDIPPHELLMKVPKSLLDNPLEIYRFIDSKHISHVIATSKGGDPNAFSNWIFEDAGPNISRGNDPMGFGEYLRAQYDNIMDGMSIEFGTLDPSSSSYHAAFGQAFNGEGLDSVDMAKVSEGLFDATKNTWEIGHDGISHISGGAMSFSDSLLETLEDIGIPITYVTVRGVATSLPFLKSIDWKRFRFDSKYRLQQLVRALRVFREGGWREAAKSIVMGFMISAFPPLSYFVSAVGLTGVAAMGTRWLATKVVGLSGTLATALNQIADSLERAHVFLRNVLNSLQRVVDVVVEVASGAVKRIVKAGADFANSVYTVAKRFASEVSKSLKSATTKTADLAAKVSNKLCSWIFTWFGSPAPAC